MFRNCRNFPKLSKYEKCSEILQYLSSFAQITCQIWDIQIPAEYLAIFPARYPSTFPAGYMAGYPATFPAEYLAIYLATFAAGY